MEGTVIGRTLTLSVKRKHFVHRFVFIAQSDSYFLTFVGFEQKQQPIAACLTSPGIRERLHIQISRRTVIKQDQVIAVEINIVQTQITMKYAVLVQNINKLK